MKLSLEAMTEAWTRYWFKPIPPFWLAACRVTVGLQLYAYLRVREPEDFSSSLGVLPALPDYLWQPVSFVGLLGLGPPSEGTLSIVWSVTLVATVATIIGLATRPASALAAAGGLYLIVLPNCYGKINHGYNALAMMLLVLPFARAGAALSIDSVVRQARGKICPSVSPGFNWPVKLIQFSFAFMLFFAGWNKIVVGGPEWVFSENLRNTLMYQNFVVRGENPTAPVVYSIIHNPWLWKTVAAGVVLGEIAFVAIMFLRRWWQRVALLAVAAAFLLGLWVAMQLPNPTLLGLLPVFVDWNWVVQRLMPLRERLSRPLRRAVTDPP